MTQINAARTDNGCGWGVKALERIKKGSFVVQYVGEVITSGEAESRGKKYDADGRTYLFDLDFNRGDDNLYTVGARKLDIGKIYNESKIYLKRGPGIRYSF